MTRRLFACAATAGSDAQFAWNLPERFPAPRVPADNPMTPAKVDLGRHLFYDTRLSGNGRQNCASCHDRARAFTDGRERAVGSTGERHPRNNDRDDTAISASARRGETLFFSQPFSCFRCDNGFTLSGASDFEGRRETDGEGVEFHNTGLYNLVGMLSYPDTGLYVITRKPEDVGKFKAPTLRNIAVTGPYMHDGSIATLEGVLDHYAAGGRTIADGPYRSVGHDNSNKGRTVRGFTLTPEQRGDFLAFLRSLTDEVFLHDPRFANPWPERVR